MWTTWAPVSTGWTQRVWCSPRLTVKHPSDASPHLFDFKKTLKHLYVPSAKEFVLVDVPEMRFICIDGIGDPESLMPMRLQSRGYMQQRIQSSSPPRTI